MSKAVPDPENASHHAPRPLDGIRVLELGQLIAGPFAGCVLGYFGAEVIKVEPPGTGDSLRNWRVLDDGGTSYWWRSMSRNKRCVTVNLREERGRELVRELAMSSDVLIENFRPGTMEKWGLGPERFAEERPELVYCRVSGYGQSGPYSSRPGFASACEAFGGFRYINGYPGETPVRPNLSMGDTLAALNAVIGVLLALVGRGRLQGRGQVVDVAIYEAVFNMLESTVPEFDGAGVVREPSGSTLTGIVPTNTYRCADGGHVVIGGNGDSIFRRLMLEAGREDLADDPRLSDNAGRVRHQREVDEAIAAWTATLDAASVFQRLEAASVPAGPIYSVREMADDPHYRARGMFESVDVDGRELAIPALSPKLAATPGRSDFPGGGLGAHNREIFCGLLGMDDEEMEALARAGVI
jgi:crotonobetainyl-CoA:carnitine CoA-transferase CaiB-like acyl-CoA transferase